MIERQGEKKTLEHTNIKRVMSGSRTFQHFYSLFFLSSLPVKRFLSSQYVLLFHLFPLNIKKNPGLYLRSFSHVITTIIIYKNAR